MSGDGGIHPVAYKRPSLPATRASATFATITCLIITFVGGVLFGAAGGREEIEYGGLVFFDAVRVDFDIFADRTSFVEDIVVCAVGSFGDSCSRGVGWVAGVVCVGERQARIFQTADHPFLRV